MKHLVVDARTALPQIDGLGTYLRQIVPQISADGERARRFRTTVLVSPTMTAFWRGAAPGATIVPSSIAPMRFGQNWQIQQQIAPLRPDLYFYPAHDPPLYLRVPLAFTVHDVTLFQLRPYFERFDRAKRGYLRVVTPAGLRRARAVFAVSETTRCEIGQIFGTHLLPKVHVTPNGMAQRAARERTEADLVDRLLYVGTDRPHKNLLRVIEGYALAQRQVPELPRLEVVGGMRTPARLEEVIRRAGVAGRVVLRGHVSEAELETCYARASMLLFPSLAEGFGLPILEAMVRSVPVITSNISACAEIAGDAAVTVDPFDVRAIASAVVRLFRDPLLREKQVRKGHERARSFTWQRTAARTFEVLSGCLASD